MKNYYRLFVAAFAMIAATSCAQFEERDILPSDNVTLEPMTIAVGGEQTRTFISEDGKSLNWCEGDKIAIFDGSGKREFTIVEGSIDGGYAEFEGEVDAAATSFFAVYPFEAAGELNAQEGTVTATAAAVQALDGRNVSDGAILSVAQFAKGVDSFEFKTAVGYFRVDVTFEDITSIIVKGANVAGSATFNAAGEVKSVDEGVNQVTLNPEGEVFEKGSYYVALLPGTTPAGEFSVMLTRAENEALEMTASKAIEIPRNAGYFLSDYKLVKKLVIKDATSLQEFLAKADTFTAGQEIEVTADIDLEGVELTGATNFAGTLVGNDHSLLNWTSNGVALVETLSGVIKNLKIDSSCSLTPANAVGAFGFLAKTVAEGGEVSYCENHADITFEPTKWGCEGTQLDNAVFFGTLVGDCNGKIAHSKNSGDLTITAKNTSTIAERGFLYIGGVAGRVDGKVAIQEDATFVNVDTCENSGNITYTVDGVPGYLFMGGVVGGTPAQKLASSTPVQANINGCINKGNVYYTFDNGGDMESGIDHGNTAKSSNYINMGGVVGYVEGSISGCTNGVQNNLTVAKVELLAPVCSEGQSASRVAVGGVAGMVMNNVTDCNNYAPIKIKGSFHHGGGTTYFGTGKETGVMTAGVVAQTGPSTNGQNFSVTNCHNYGPLTINYLQAGNESGIKHYAGGVGGDVYTEISNCSNGAEINIYSTGSINYLGGVAGYIGYDANTLTNNGLINYNFHKSGTNHLGGNCYIGGVLGYGSTSYSVTNAINNKKVTINVTKGDGISLSRQFSGGGVAGRCGNAGTMTNNAEIKINECDNSGSPIWAGVVAVPASNTATNLHNKANVTYNGGTLNGLKIGGVIGMCSSKALTNCSNTHPVSVEATALTGTLSMGGIVADCDASGTINTLNNSGSLTTNVGDTAYIGGIVGDGDKGLTTYDGVINSGTITYNIGERVAKKLVFGGICAFSYDGNTYKECENSGAITITAGGDASSVGYLGGIVGYNDSETKSQKVEGCTVTGDMTINCPATWYAGGVLAWGGKWSSSNQCSMKENTVTADIKITSTTQNHYIGGMAGLSGLNQVFKDNSFDGEISVGSTSGNGMVGGMLGATFIKPSGKTASSAVNASQTFESCNVKAQISYDATNSYAGLLLGGAMNIATYAADAYAKLSTMTVTYGTGNTIKSGTTVNGAAATASHINSSYSTDTFTLTTNGADGVQFE